LLEERCRVPRVLDDSKIVTPRFLGSPEFQFALDRVFGVAWVRVRHRQVQWQLRFRAIEIEGITVHGMLSPEFVICELPISQAAPENSLAVGCVFAQIASPVRKTDLSISEASPAESEIARTATP
jgi:hypothetical protein